jgi:hypothetical protein
VQERTGLSKTDAVNRAITVYEFFSRELGDGNEILVHDPQTGKAQTVRFF